MRKGFFIAFVAMLTVLSCGKEAEDFSEQQPSPVPPSPDNEALTIKINDFIWQNMNAYYLWQRDVYNLKDDRFGKVTNANFANKKYVNFLSSYGDPEGFFQSLKYAKDRFSFIVSDYRELENNFKGISKTTGMNFDLTLFSRGKDDVLMYVNYVATGSPAEKAGIKRGDVITHIDNKLITINNYRELLFAGSDTKNYGVSTFDKDKETFVWDQSKNKSVTSIEFDEDPILVHKVIEQDGKKIAYLMYNSFIGGSKANKHLNDVFGEFKSQGATELVLDLRYNGGGSVETSQYLGSMIAGQHKGEVYVKQVSNEKAAKEFGSPIVIPIVDKMETDGGEVAINSLNVERLYVLTSQGTASASELVINGLSPFIKVIKVGDVTRGKNTASITLYDYKVDADGKLITGADGRLVKSDDHFWAIQPLVLKSENSLGFGDYEDGFKPDIAYQEFFLGLGVLGDVNEPMLKLALDDIKGVQSKPETGGGFHKGTFGKFQSKSIDNSRNHTLMKDNMYVDFERLIRK